jgi:hypothetical protein
MNLRDKIRVIAAQLRAAASYAGAQPGACATLACLQVKALSAAADLEQAVDRLTALDAGRTWWPPRDRPGVPAGQDRVQVLAVIEDPRYGEEPFVDIVTFWPAGARWTVTHSCRSDASAADHEVRIRCHRPLDPVPEGVSWA